MAPRRQWYENMRYQQRQSERAKAAKTGEAQLPPPPPPPPPPRGRRRGGRRRTVRRTPPPPVLVAIASSPSPSSSEETGEAEEADEPPPPAESRALLVDLFRASNGHRIIVFRDGVSESEFNQVMKPQLDQIVQAYQHLGEANIPMFTVIVDQNNHHTKLIQTNIPDNVPPGTVGVDTKIVHPRNYDFYLCAQAGMIGTSSPAHYHVLLDEIVFSPDELQNLVQSLSYVYQRSTTAISIVASICYAHLAAAQVGQFMKFEDLSDTLSGNGSITSSESIPVHELSRLHGKIQGSMFF